MKPARLFILFTMGVIFYFIVFSPGIYDSHEMGKAWYDYHNSPNEETQKELAVARASVKKHTLEIDSFLALVLVSLGLVFVKSGTSKKPNQDYPKP